METFKKRQKEMRRLERQQEKAAKRKEIKARKAAGIVEPSEIEQSEYDPTTQGEASPSPAESMLPSAS